MLKFWIFCYTRMFDKTSLIKHAPLPTIDPPAFLLHPVLNTAHNKLPATESKQGLDQHVLPVHLILQRVNVVIVDVVFGSLCPVQNEGHS